MTRSEESRGGTGLILALASPTLDIHSGCWGWKGEVAAHGSCGSDLTQLAEALGPTEASGEMRPLAPQCACLLIRANTE